MALPQFIFGGNTGIKNPEELARARMMAEALLGPQRPAQNVGEGLAVLGQAIRGRREMNAVNAASNAGNSSAQSAIAKALGGSSFPAAPGAPTASDYADTRVKSASGDSADSIRQGLVSRGMNPQVADAFVMNFQDESGLNPGINEKSPTVAGSRGGFGLAQWTGPRRRALESFAAQQGKPVSDQDTQLDFLMSELKGPEAAAWQSIQSAPDTGHAAAAIVNQFLRPRDDLRARREASYLKAGGGVQVASNDPAASFGVPFDPTQPYDAAAVARAKNATQQIGVPYQPAAGPAQAISQALTQNAPTPQRPNIAAALNGYTPGAPAAETPAGQRVVQQMVNPQSMTGGAPLPMMGMPPQQQAPQPVPDQSGKPQGPGSPGEIRKGSDGKNYQWAETTGMAGATGSSGWIETSMGPQGGPQAQAAPQAAPQGGQDLSRIPVEAGGNAGALPPGPRLPSVQDLMEAAQNPWLNDEQRGVVNMLLKKQLDAQDPNNALDAEYKRAQIEALKQKGDAGFTLGQGEVRFDANGHQIAAGAAKAETQPAAVQEYQFAKSQGFPGTFADWEASKKGGMSLSVDPATGAVTFQQGNNIKPMTEGQSKDTTFATRAEGALPLVDQFGDALTNLTESTGGKVPIVGNYMKSPEYQKAEQAGNEFLQAILRKDTGAAITAGEMAEYGSVYLPRPGDSPELLVQKKASRSRALEALKAGMTPQALLAQEKAIAASGQPAPGKKTVIDGYTIEEVP
ncbi:hypothetical protein FJV76_14260 [Mesorhizobium sp. WSM4303]|uniref:phage tail tip lysozyme n=1 Tax=Mesorhizobium sp. WSM4303 TaxID=2589887 RepID=UPI00115C9A0A|nr:phage tail tip lysozyme [Mesorhizobium sp. WSM4303]TRD03797.1 hypothetical protein FJV76_14260 [Mesorhizobium sp. WSM4303]